MWLNREQRRQLLKESIPSDIDILISKVAELCVDFTKADLKLLYLSEPDYRKAGAAEKFRNLLVELENMEPDEHQN